MSKVAPITASGEKEEDQLSLEQSKHLLRTKFYVPPIRSKQIARPRLSDLITGGLDRALILVSAPAGYGKTTLVSSWLKEKEIPSAWLSLDIGDNDPIRFLQYLLAALVPIAPVNRVSCHAIIVCMDIGNIHLFKERWKAVEEIERQELRAMSPEEHWRKLNAIVRFAIETGMEYNKDKSEMEVILRWAKLKTNHEAR